MNGLHKNLYYIQGANLPLCLTWNCPTLKIWQKWVCLKSRWVKTTLVLSLLSFDL